MGSQISDVVSCPPSVFEVLISLTSQNPSSRCYRLESENNILFLALGLKSIFIRSQKIQAKINITLICVFSHITDFNNIFSQFQLLFKIHDIYMSFYFCIWNIKKTISRFQLLFKIHDIYMSFYFCIWNTKKTISNIWCLKIYRHPALKIVKTICFATTHENTKYITNTELCFQSPH